MGLFGKKTNKVRADTADSHEPMTDDMLLSAILGQKKITREEAKKIPTVTACLDFIAGTLDSLPIRLYQKTEQGIEIVKDDVRVNLLNQDTGDTLTAKQFWRAILEDYYLGSGGYAYIERAGTRIRSIRYVEDSKVTVIKNEHPIFKDYDIYVYDNKYYPFEFLKFLRKTTDGCTSCSIVKENDLIFGVSYNTLIYQENLVKKGGNKRGFLKSKWLKAAGIRAAKTVAQTAVALLPAAATLSQVDWMTVAGTAALAGVASILTSVAGLPEIKED